jgi:DNA polymerase III epsilon subunit-like protein
LTQVAFDTETRGLDWWDGQTAFLVSWADDKGSYVEEIEGGAPRFRAAVDKADTLVAHNLSFDVHQVRESLGLDLLQTGKRLIDTDLLARVAVPERRFA